MVGIESNLREVVAGLCEVARLNATMHSSFKVPTTGRTQTKVPNIGNPPRSKPEPSEE